MAISKVTSGGIADGTLSVEDIADDAVTAAKLANSINTDIATGVTGNTTANAALPKAGGAMTGTITGFTSTGIDDNADATAITINSSEQVGIGLTSPDTTLHIKGSAQIAKLETTSGTGQNYIRFADSSGDKAYFGFASGANDHLTLFNQENADIAFGTNDTERMRIDSSGRVTMPSQPAFKAGLNANQTVSSSNAPVVFNEEHYDIGGNYSTSTGKFTAPVAGIYSFHALVIYMDIANNTSMTDKFYVEHNGSTRAYSSRRAYYVLNNTGNGGYYTDWATVTLQLAANDAVWIQTKPGVIHGNTYYSYFQGHLVG